MEIQEILFGSHEPQEKLKQIKQIPTNNDLLSYGMMDVMKRIDDEKAVEFGQRLRQLVIDMTGFDPAEIVIKPKEDDE